MVTRPAVNETPDKTVGRGDVRSVLSAAVL